MSRAAVFLDRDGVLVEEVYYPQTGETEAPLRPQDVRLRGSPRLSRSERKVRGRVDVPRHQQVVPINARVIGRSRPVATELALHARVAVEKIRSVAAELIAVL